MFESLKDKYGITIPKEKRNYNVKGGILIANSKSYDFELKCVKSTTGRYKIPIKIHYKNGTCIDHYDSIESSVGVFACEVDLRVF